MLEFSIIIPVYNVESYMARCLDSILAQTYSNFEIIVVIDGSTDRSAEICEEYKRTHYDKMRIIYQDNAGPGAARNNGLLLAKGRYIFFVDSDDTVADTALATLHRTIVSSNYPDIVVFAYKAVNINGKKLSENREALPKDVIMNASRQRDILTIATLPGNRIVKRQFLETSGLKFPIKVWYEDLIVTISMLALSETVVYIDEILYYYLWRNDSITKNKNTARMIDLLNQYNELVSYFKANNIFRDYYYELEFLVVAHLLLAGSVRLIRTDRKNPLLSEFYTYTKVNFPDFINNPYLNRLGKRKLLILRLLLKKRYRAIAFVFLIHGLINGTR